MKRALMFLVLLFTPTSTLFSQDECRQLLADYIRSMEKISAPVKGKVYYLHAALQNRFRQPAEAPKEIEIKACITANLMFVSSTLMQMYADTSSLFLVLPAAHRIIRSKGISAARGMERQMEMLNMQRKVLDACTVIECVSEGNIRKIKLRPSGEIAEQYRLRTMQLNYSTVEKRMHSVQLIYSEKSKIAEQLIEYKQIDFDSPYRFNHSSAAAYILTKQGKLRDEFEGYMLITSPQPLSHLSPTPLHMERGYGMQGFQKGALFNNARHCGLDPQSPEKYSLIGIGLRVKPAMTFNRSEACKSQIFITAGR